MKKLISILHILLIISCAPIPRAMMTEAQIVNTETDRIYVIFREAHTPDRYTGGWFHVPGMGLLNKDSYDVNLVITPKKSNQ